MTLCKVGLTPGTQQFSGEDLQQIVLNIENGDFGDVSDDQTLVSLDASIGGEPHIGIYPPVVAFARPEFNSVLLITFDELKSDPELRKGVETFGFNPDTLQPRK
jgi:hypothetical protein